MKIDTYIKTLLTLITIFLGVLAADKIYNIAVPEAQAEQGQWSCGTVQAEGKGGKYPRWDLLPHNYANKFGWRFMTMTSYERKRDGEVHLRYCGK